MTSPTVRLGSRASPLARAQTTLVGQALAAVRVPSFETFVETAGDRDRVRPLVELGGKAVWTKELDEALLDDRIDAAVHSLKDVETVMPAGLVLAAVLPRADPRDRLIGADRLSALPPGARVGTSSPRRAAQLLARRPDCETVLLRGNVATRLQRVAEGQVHASFLAAAGLDRLGVDAGVPLEIEDWLPAAAQGIVGITARAEDRGTLDALSRIDDSETHLAALAERAVLAGIGGSCRTALAAHARRDPRGHLSLAAELLSPDGSASVRAARAEAVSDAAGAVALGTAVASALLEGATDAIRASL